MDRLQIDSYLHRADDFYQHLVADQAGGRWARKLKRLANFLFKVMVRIGHARPREEPCDVLILHFLNPGKNPNLKRFIKTIESRFPNDLVRFHQLETVAQQLRGWKFSLPAFSDRVPIDTYYFAPYAAYLTSRYKPRLFITFLEWNPLSIFLYLYAKANGATVINIAHALTSNSPRCSIFTFDYYFVFGPSSVEHIAENPIKVGCANIIAAGSPNIHGAFDAAANPDGGILYFSDWLAPGLEETIKDNMKLIAEWAETYHVALRVKLHPLEEEAVIREIFANVENVEFLDRGMSIQSALEDASIAIVHWSCASLEAAVMRRPVVVANRADDIDDEFLELERYFPRRARTPSELASRIDEVKRNYAHYIAQGERFADRHLARRYDAQEFIADTVRAIRDGALLGCSVCDPAFQGCRERARGKK